MQVRLPACFLLLAWAVCIQTVPAFAEAPYWKCGTDRVTVVASEGAFRCERLLSTIVRYEEVLADLAGLERGTTLPPLTLYQLTRDDARRYMFSAAELEEQRRSRYITYSKYRPGGDDVVALAIDQGGEEPIQSLLFLHGQQLLTYGVARSYPVWYQLGMAALLNGLVIRPDGTVILNRKPKFAARLQNGERPANRLNLREVLDTGPSSLAPADFNELAGRAHSWAQFGLLTTPERRRSYRELALLMRQGTPLEEASPAAFGKTFAELDAEFRSGRWHSQVAFRLPPSGSAVTMNVPVQLTPAEYEAAMQIVRERTIDDRVATPR